MVIGGMFSVFDRGVGRWQWRLAIVGVAGDVVGWVTVLRNVLGGLFQWRGPTAPSSGGFFGED